MTTWLHLVMPFSNRWAAVHSMSILEQRCLHAVPRENSWLGDVRQGLGGCFLSCTVADSSVPEPRVLSPAVATFCRCWWVVMDVLWMFPLLLIPLLMWSSSTFVFYFKKFFYVAWMMVLAMFAIPLCILKSGGRDIENMRWVCFA